MNAQGTEQPQLWLLAGGNGAGKSTFYRTQLQGHDIPFINAHILARQHFPQAPEAHAYEAARIAERMRFQLLEEGQSFCFETVFSHPSKIDFVAQAKTLGYQIVMVFIHLGDPNLNLARVAQRVSEGGRYRRHRRGELLHPFRWVFHLLGSLYRQ